jgi:hypothetical protein
VLHDTYTDAMICNSSRGEKIRVLRPLQEYSWRIRILSLSRLCQTRGHEEVFSGVLGFCPGEVIESRPLRTYLLGRYSRCLSRKWCPTNMRACSIAIPSARSLSYTVRNASELILPRRRLVATSSVEGTEVTSTLLVIGLYQRMRNPPFPVLIAHLRAQLREGFYHQGTAKYGA